MVRPRVVTKLVVGVGGWGCTIDTRGPQEDPRMGYPQAPSHHFLLALWISFRHPNSSTLVSTGTDLAVRRRFLDLNQNGREGIGVDLFRGYGLSNLRVGPWVSRAFRSSEPETRDSLKLEKTRNLNEMEHRCHMAWHMAT